MGARTFAQAFSPDVDFAPATGTITSWRVTGEGKLKLRVIESGPEGGWSGAGTSAAATNLEGQPNATSLPIEVGDMIGVDFPAGSGLSVIGWDKVANAERFEWFSPELRDAGEFREPGFVEREERLLLSAEEVLEPVLSSISPPVGGTAGGNTVTIMGKYLDGATGVTFGSTPASSFRVDSPNQLTAVAPASAAGDVSVRVTGPGGTSEVSSAARYTFTGPPAIAMTTTNPLTGAVGPSLAPKPTISDFSQSAARWKRGGSLARISRAPVGTTYGFSLNEPATAALSFTHLVAGRRVNGRCVAATHGNAGRPRCKRDLAAGSLPVSAHAGANTVRFQGRLSNARTLQPGSYGVTIIARDARGLQSSPQSLSFTIVPG